MSTSPLPTSISPLDLSRTKESNFVRNSWTLSSLRYRPARIVVDEHDKPHVWTMDARVYLREHAEYVDAMLERPTTTCLLARSNDEDGLVLSWICWSCADATRTRVHYLYSDKTFRRMGFAKRLLGMVPTDKPVEFTHWTRMVPFLKLPQAWEWSPVSGWRM